MIEEGRAKIEQMRLEQLAKIDGTLTTLEYQKSMLEDSDSNVQVLKAMSEATKAYKVVNSKM